MGTDGQHELEADIKATAEDIAADAERIRSIEAEKARLDPSDPRIIELANESEALAAKVAVKAQVETALVTEAHEDATSN
jgi:hypothetical protein